MDEIQENYYGPQQTEAQQMNIELTIVFLLEYGTI
jgi:hypothetical protein